MVFAFAPYVDLAAVYAREGKMDETKLALAEARRLNPNLTVKLLQTGAPNLPPLFEGVRKAGLGSALPPRRGHMASQSCNGVQNVYDAYGNYVGQRAVNNC